MKAPKVKLLFSTPVMKYKMDRPFTQEEIDEVVKYSFLTYNNEGNKTTNDKHVFNNPAMFGLRDVCYEFVNDYFQKVFKPKLDVKLVLTQSWINYTNTNEFHHPHEHPNSIISGVLYLHAKKKEDSLRMLRRKYCPILIEPTHFDDLNALSWKFPIETGEVIVFPSDVTHCVDTVKSDETRISLAFNTFVTGVIGNDETLSGLNIPALQIPGGPNVN